MDEEKKAETKKRIKVRDLGKNASKDLSDEEMRRISGGAIYSCPGDCKTLVIHTAQRNLTLVMNCLDEGIPLAVPPKKKR